MTMKHTVWLLLLALTAPPLAWGYGEDSVPAEATTEARYGNTPPDKEPYGGFVKEPYRRFFLKPLEYTGPGRDIPEPTDIDAVKIGFLGPIKQTVSVATGGMSHEEPLGRMMLQGVRLALEQANARGGYRGKLPYDLDVRNDNGLWGASGDEIIRMVYKDDVRAIIGTIDGANSHIAIRVALKCEIPVMNTGDTDPTFIETKIPWVFRCISDDRSMCYLLADYTFKKLGKERVAALRAGNRYGRMSIDEFRDAATRLGHPLITELQYQLGTEDFNLQLDRIENLDPDAVITYGDARESGLILKQMRERGMDQLFIGSDRMVCDEFLEIVGDNPGEVIAGYPFNPDMNRPKYRAFYESFVERFGEEPDQYAAHAFDGACMVIDAIEEAGLNRAKIRDALAAMKTYEGATGTMEFDAIYNDVSPASMAILEDGEWKIYSRKELDIPDARTSMAR